MKVVGVAAAPVTSRFLWAILSKVEVGKKEKRSMKKTVPICGLQKGTKIWLLLSLPNATCIIKMKTNEANLEMEVSE